VSATTGLHFQFGDPASGGGDYSISAAGSAGVHDGQWHVLSLLRNGTTGAIRLDGNVLAESGSAFGSSQVSGTGTFHIGGSGDNTDNFQGAIAEVLVYNTPTGVGNFENVEGYLEQKNGLTAVPEPSQYAMVFGVACIVGAIVIRRRNQLNPASA
jgi:hypothetical protein